MRRSARRGGGCTDAARGANVVYITDPALRDQNARLHGAAFGWIRLASTLAQGVALTPETAQFGGSRSRPS